MAVYYGILIESNVIGGNPDIKVLDASISFKSLMNSLGNGKMLLRSLDLWSDNRMQLIQSISFIRTKIDGTQDKITKVPQLDSFQTDNVLNNYEVGNIEFDENSKFEYELLPDTITRIILNFDEDVENVLSVSSQLGIPTEDKLENLIHPLTEDEKNENINEKEILIDELSETIELTDEQRIELEKTKQELKKSKEKKKKLNWWWITGLALLTYMILQKIDNK